MTAVQFSKLQGRPRDDMASVMNGIRAYMRELRVRQGLSQHRLAEAMGLSEGALRSFESGGTEEIKVVPLVRALRLLGAPLSDIEQLVDVPTTEEGLRLANEWLSKREQEQIAAEARRFIAEQSPEMVAAIARLYTEQRSETS